MSKIWTDRVNEILSDPQKARIAAILYHLVWSTMNMPITRKRTCPEELLWDEAYGIMDHLEKEGGAHPAHTPTHQIVDKG